MIIKSSYFFAGNRHCEARSAVAIQEDLQGLLRHYVPRDDGMGSAYVY